MNWRAAVLDSWCRARGVDPRRFTRELRALDTAGRETLARHREQRLERLLAAGQRAPLYRRLHADGERPLVRRADLDPAQVATGDLGRARRLASSGTSGQPVVVWHDPAYLARMLLRRRHVLGWHGIGAGAREARLWGRPPASRLARAQAALLGRRFFDATRGLDALATWSPDYLYGYSSLILRAALGWRGRGPLPGLRLTVCTAEGLAPYQQEQIAGAFGCPVAMEYGCTETDLIAFACPEGRAHILADHILLEVVDAAGRPLPDGEVGDLVVTDLDNLLFPLVRYHLGDAGAISREPCPCGRTLPVLAGLEGRSADRWIVQADGRTLHASHLGALFGRLAQTGSEFAQFRAVQTRAGELSVEVEGVPAPRQAPLAAAIIEDLRAATPGGLTVSVRCGPIERPPGGKLRYFESRLPS